MFNVWKNGKLWRIMPTQEIVSFAGIRNDCLEFSSGHGIPASLIKSYDYGLGYTWLEFWGDCVISLEYREYALVDLCRRNGIDRINSSLYVG